MVALAVRTERLRARLVDLIREVAAEGRSDWRESWLRRW